MTVVAHPLTRERWDDLEALFGPRGACEGCWCMWYRVMAREYKANGPEGNRLALKAKVDAGHVPGLLAYVDGEVAGWCAVGPREEFPRLENSKVMGRVDDRPAWSVVCFFIGKDHRRAGLTATLLEAAVEHARANGATIVEGYPVDPKGRTADGFVFNGIASTFERAGFQEVARRSETRPIMRLSTGG
jgi:GNAT superfamily N-acetyltransferase